MTIRISDFHGISPRIHPSLLNPGMAVRAHNCRLKSGKLVPLRRPSRVTVGNVHLLGGLESKAGAKSMYCWKHTTATGEVAVDYLLFKGVVEFAEGHIADDEYDRIFVAGDTGVSFVDGKGVTYENVPLVLLYDRSTNAVVEPFTFLKDPPSAPAAALAEGESVTDSKTVFYTSFFISWVDKWGYESPLSDAASVEGSDIGVIAINDGTQVKISGVSFPDGATNPSKMRLYMARSGSGDTEASADGIQFLKEWSVSQVSSGGTSGITVSVHPGETAENEPGIESPPADLGGIVSMPGGWYAGFAKSMPHTVLFSDIGIVTSWPTAYRYDVKDNVVGVAATANGVVVLTDGWPWVMVGTAPEAMTCAKLAGPAACVSSRGYCVYRNTVYFISNEGLMAVTNDATAGMVCVNVTAGAFSKDQWLAMNPSSGLIGQHDGALSLFFRDQNGRSLGGLVIDLAEGANAITTHMEGARCLCVDNRTDKMFYVREQ